MRRRQGDFGAGPVLSLAGAAALMLAVTLAACGEADNKKPSPQPDTTPNGSITTQPDTNGTDDSVTDGRGESPGDSMNGGNNETGGAVPGDGGTSTGGEDARSRKYDRALAASLSQLILNRIGG